MTHDLTVGSMTVRVHDDTGVLAVAAAEEAADVLRDAIAARGVANVMFASGNSQIGFLEHLIVAPGLDWTCVVGFHMDEYCGIDGQHPASFRRYMRERITEPITASSAPAGDVGAFHEIHGDADDFEAECDRYAGLLRANPLDLCCLGIGENGHLAFNDPPVADFADPRDVKVVELDQECRQQQVGEGHFPDLDAVPREAITVTIPALLRAKRVLAIVPEARKRVPVDRALHGPIDTACPASILRTCDHVTLHLDRDSAGA